MSKTNDLAETLSNGDPEIKADLEKVFPVLYRKLHVANKRKATHQRSVDVAVYDSNRHIYPFWKEIHPLKTEK
ncbi:hypothetical protein QQ020_03160 [Fulvivirgaceae bacterium BMA12]|uniref:Uncharacterized protein n=1 Tax=Agaribacillus aureus TaxID=3051825 RepID=A0ABT8L2I2_9BACT|nr:hypothetical protein [Fulvivirgaceae bacterium BMA12]